MVDHSPTLTVLTNEAIEAARAFTIGEVVPRLIPSEAALPLHVMPVPEFPGGTATAVLRPCLLLDVGMPGDYVRIPLIQPEGEGPRLGFAELWQADRHQPMHHSHAGSVSPKYVPLFEELSEALI